MAPSVRPSSSALSSDPGGQAGGGPAAAGRGRLTPILCRQPASKTKGPKHFSPISQIGGGFVPTWPRAGPWLHPQL